MAIIESYIAMVPLPLAVLLSVLVNIVISIVGVIPSAFLTAINVSVFGFWGGFLVSLIGEIAGSLVAFWLYRKGFRKFIEDRSKHKPRMKKLLDASPREAFLLVIGLRLMPFVPSGLVTLYAAVSKMRFGSFAVASSIGKVPALLIEVSAMYAVVKWTGIGKFIVFGLAVGAFYLVWKKVEKPRND
ncbi:MAG TPA: TVP38/TMEM64 family protein [Paenisporosarcina sp.]|nr:TVP38/TMEM64 family protein [Paenisporosarcina sp.]